MKKRHTSNYKPRSLRRYERKARRNLLLSLGVIILFIYLFFFWGLPLLIKGVTLVQHRPDEKEKSPTEDVKLSPPVLSLPYEATNTASIKVKGYTQPNTKIEILIGNEVKSSSSSDESGQFESGFIDLSRGDNFISGKTIDDKGHKSLASKSIRVFFSSEKPKLEITEPEDNKLLKGGDKKITIRGKTDQGNAVNINGNIIIVNSEGLFFYELPLSDGDNQIIVTSTNAVGNTTKIERKVNYLAN